MHTELDLPTRVAPTASPEVSVRLPGPLREHVGGSADVQVSAVTVGDALRELVHSYPALRRHLFTDDGVLRGYVNVYLNEIDTRDRGGSAAPVASGDVLTIVPSIAGG